MTLQRVARRASCMGLLEETGPPLVEVLLVVERSPVDQHGGMSAESFPESSTELSASFDPGVTMMGPS